MNLLALAAAAAIAVLPGPPPTAPTPVPAGIVRAELAVSTSDGLVLPATLHVPAGARPGLPGMVLVHGSGPHPRGDLAAEATAFARAGIVTLTYDKRTVGYSFIQRSYSQLADDAIAAAAVLRGRAEVDPAKVGLWGLSEGGWVAPLAAARDPRTAFVVVVGANGVAPLRQQTWSDASRMEYFGVRGSLVDASSRTLYRLAAGLGLFTEAHYDPGPPLRALTLPMLGIWGALDRATPPVESVAAYREFLDQAGNRQYTLRTFDGAEHALRASVTGYEERGVEFAPGYVDLVGSWVADVASGRTPPTSVEGTGEQPRLSAEVPPLAWYESVGVQAGAFVVMLAGFAGLGIAAAWRRARGRSGPPAPWPARVLAGAGFVAVPGCLFYLGSVMATRGRVFDPGLMIAGRPLAWLALQALAVVAVGAAVALGVRTWRRGDLRRHAPLLAAGAVFVPWAVYWGLLLP